MSPVRPRRLVSSLVLLLALLFALPQPALLAQPPACPPAAILLQPTDPAYADAMELKRDLESQGFIVHCVFPSKLGSIFRVWEGGVSHSTIEGEASFRTDDGDVGVVFMPKPQTFADFKIKEHREGGGYLYRFAGTPRVWDVDRFGSAHRIYFLKHNNQLVLSDDKLRARLEQALHLSTRTQ
jgi:hypothetical protein